jgi:hypothetical protein
MFLNKIFKKVKINDLYQHFIRFTSKPYLPTMTSQLNKENTNSLKVNFKLVKATEELFNDLVLKEGFIDFK